MTNPIDLSTAFAGLQHPWSPLTVGVLNDYDIRVVKTEGQFTAHAHPDTDELFLAVAGSLVIRFDDDEVHLGPGQLYIVPRGTRHQPVAAEGGAEVVLIEPSSTMNTGDTRSHLTAARRVAPDAALAGRSPEADPGARRAWASTRTPTPYPEISLRTGC